MAEEPLSPGFSDVLRAWPAGSACGMYQNVVGRIIGAGRKVIGVIGLKLSRTVTYALQATLQLAAKTDNGAPVPSSRLAADGGMPERFLLQVLRDLVSHGVLNSTRGVDGGYVLARDPEDISLLELIEAIDGPMGVSVSSNGWLPPQVEGKLEKLLGQITEVSRRELSALRIASLLPKPRRRRRRG
ncbi:MAG: Rrf2 family transcriptional regulator [Thermoguttaceae bacterium]